MVAGLHVFLQDVLRCNNQPPLHVYMQTATDDMRYKTALRHREKRGHMHTRTRAHQLYSPNRASCTDVMRPQKQHTLAVAALLWLLSKLKSTLESTQTTRTVLTLSFAMNTYTGKVVALGCPCREEVEHTPDCVRSHTSGGRAPLPVNSLPSFFHYSCIHHPRIFLANGKASARVGHGPYEQPRRRQHDARVCLFATRLALPITLLNMIALRVWALYPYAIVSGECLHVGLKMLGSRWGFC